MQYLVHGLLGADWLMHTSIFGECWQFRAGTLWKHVWGPDIFLVSNGGKSHRLVWANVEVELAMCSMQGQEVLDVRMHSEHASEDSKIREPEDFLQGL